ncbi:MAG: hypothetical protein RLO81_03475 [Fulvivirga sp.]|uniref:hypothetical protein n=1 Tax=Fulvivirga sp. TaxID=1931237 RepID=UPI0032EF7BD5
MKNVIYYLPVLTLLLFVQCRDESPNKCFEEKGQTISNKEGTVYFHSHLEAYAIYAPVENTFDSQLVFVPCEIPEKYKKDGVKIIFSGAYATLNISFDKIPGQEFYQLNLTDLSLLTD